MISVAFVIRLTFVGDRRVILVTSFGHLLVIVASLQGDLG